MAGISRTSPASFLKANPKDGDLLLGDRLEKEGCDLPSKSLLLVFVRIDSLLQILCKLVQTLGLENEDEIEDVPLKANSSSITQVDHVHDVLPA